MRLPIPLVPIAILIRCERRPLGPLRPRISVLGLLIITAIAALYMTRITLPARKARYQSANRAVLQQLDLLNRAAEEERGRERGIRGSLEGCLAAARREEIEATKWPEGSEKRAMHEHWARLWTKAARDVPMPFAEFAARRARALERRAGELREGLRLSEGDLERFEQFARTAGELPDSTEWQRLDLTSKLAEVKGKRESEQEAERVKAFLATMPRS